jgi:hypothetical protein
MLSHLHAAGISTLTIFVGKELKQLAVGFSQ